MAPGSGRSPGLTQSTSLRGIAVVDAGDGPEVAWLEGGLWHLVGCAPALLPDLLAALLEGSPPAGASRAIARPLRVLPPIAPAARIMAVAQNYPAHAAEAGGLSPDAPIIFMKPASAFVGDGEEIAIPPVTSALDYEAELAVVIGARLYEVDGPAALAGVAGYSLANDGSARDLQPAMLAGKPIVDWFSAKVLHGCSSLGPVIVPAWDVGDVAELRITGTLNGDVVQDDTPASMKVGIADLLAFISARMALEPGDVVLTGTPAGVGKARGRFLQPGDRFVVQAPRLGSLRTTYATRT